MAIRKFRSKMKPIVIVITLAFALSSLIAAYYSMSSQLAMKNYAFKVNGEKVDMVNIARTKNMIAANLQNRGDEKVLETLAVDQAIEDELVQQMADVLKIKVSDKDVKREYEAVESNIKDKEQFKRMLQAQGYTKASFKKEIERSLKRMRVLESFVENADVSDEEVAKLYNENRYSMFGGADFDTVKDTLKQSMKQEEGNKEFYKELQALKKNMKIDDAREQFVGMEEKVQTVKDGVEFTNVDYSKIYVQLLAKGVKPEEADAQTEAYMENQAKLLKAAAEYNVDVDNALPVLARVEDAYKKMVEKAREQVKYTDKDLQTYFNANRSNYDIYPSADSYIAAVKLEPSQADKDAAKVKAEEIRKNLTVNNFAETAKSKSDCPSAAQGGDLGWFSQGDMVPEFEKAAFSGKVGEIYPEIVSTMFGQHIIYITDRNDQEKKAKASHILVKYKVSDATINEAIKEAQATAEKISSGEINFADLPKDKYNGGTLIENISESGYIPGVGFNEKLAEAIYKAPLNKVEVKREGDNVFMFQKTRENQFKAAEFADVKDRVKEEYVNQKAFNALETMLKRK